MKYRQIGKARRRARLRKKSGLFSDSEIADRLALDIETGTYNNPKSKVATS